MEEKTQDPMLMRRVKLWPTGEYSAENAKDMKASLCVTCGIADLCPVPSNVVRFPFAKLTVRACRKFVPVLTFQPPIIGLHGRFNTMRLGKAWVERLEVGKTRVALLNGRSGERVCFAIVEGVHLGSFDEMVQQHAARNHLAVHDPKVEDPVSVVLKVLRGAYGKFMGPQSQLTVIQLRRIDDESEGNNR